MIKYLLTSAVISGITSLSLIGGGVQAEARPPVRQQLSLFETLLPRRPISLGNVGLNAFANERQFGTVGAQLRETSRALKVNRLRVLFAWNDQVQPNASSKPFWGFYDEIARSIPRRSRAIVVITGLPSWVRNQGADSARERFTNDWARSVAARYGKHPRIEGFQIWNEPNDSGNRDNSTLGFVNNPEQFVSFTASVGAAIRDVAGPKKKRISGATTSLLQNFPETADYFSSMLDAGLGDHVDIIATHFYGESVETLLFSERISSSLIRANRPIWVTESGAKGSSKHLEYAERLWPFLLNEFPRIARIYSYQFTEGTPQSTTFGLRSGSDGRTYSDLYRFLAHSRR